MPCGSPASLPGVLGLVRTPAAAPCAAVQGIGDAVAAALALTTALGGARHASCAALAKWVRASADNAKGLHAWLLTRWAGMRSRHRRLHLWLGRWLRGGEHILDMQLRRKRPVPVLTP